MKRPVAQVSVTVAFGSEVDLALAQIENLKGFSLAQQRETPSILASAATSHTCISTSDPTILGHLPRDGQLYDRGGGSADFVFMGAGIFLNIFGYF